jgi:uncharacterized protein (DUF305 family)
MPVRGYLCEIIDTQRREIGEMRAWLKQKNIPTVRKAMSATRLTCMSDRNDGVQ